MEENFNPVAQTRANYYTPGSPVQFVCVELLKGDVSGEHAVCLTFKNISRVTLTALEIHFKCKGVDGVILCEDKFEYRDLQVKPGELFGQDDAVFITAKAITSVDVSLCNVYNGKRVVHLDGIKRVRLPAPRRLAPELQKTLEARMNRTGLKYQPQVFENGWYCACGAFHPTEEDTVYCSECGCDRILLQNALNTLLQPAAPADEMEMPLSAPAAPAAKDTVLSACLNGTVVPLADVKDEAFASGALGDGIAIEPIDGELVAPADGEISSTFETHHAVGMTTTDGAELLMHIGIDTVKLGGKHFTYLVNEGDKVKKGQPLIRFELEAIKAEGYPVTTPLIVCNTDDYAAVAAKASGTVKQGDALLELKH